jgi:hypothetical protein
MKRVFQLTGLGFILAAASFAQESNAGFTYDIGFGFTTPVGDTGRHVNEGWNLQGGFGYNFSSWVGVKIDLGFSQFGLNGVTLNNIGSSGGSVNVFSTTLDPVVHLNPNGHVDFYLTGGGGIFHQNEDFFPYLNYYPPFAGQFAGNYSVNKPGIDAGAGFAMGTRFHGKIFAEAKYERVFLGNYHTDYLPVTVGFRWK